MATRSRFGLGRFVATPGALEAFEEASDAPLGYLMRHAAGDWGIVDEEDAQSNEDAVKHGDRILSAYRLSNETKIWIITEADRSATTILLPDEY